MQPLDKNEKQRLMDQAAKAFPSQPRAKLEQEFNEMETLLSKRFTRPDGALPQREQTRLNELAEKFWPKP